MARPGVADQLHLDAVARADDVLGGDRHVGHRREGRGHAGKQVVAEGAQGLAVELLERQQRERELEGLERRVAIETLRGLGLRQSRERHRCDARDAQHAVGVELVGIAAPRAFKRLLEPGGLLRAAHAAAGRVHRPQLHLQQHAVAAADARLPRAQLEQRVVVARRRGAAALALGRTARADRLGRGEVAVAAHAVLGAAAEALEDGLLLVRRQVAEHLHLLRRGRLRARRRGEERGRGREHGDTERRPTTPTPDYCE